MAELRLDLNFKRADGYNAKLSVADARADITALEASTLMDQIIGTQMFQPSGSPMAEKISAQLVTTDIAELAL